MARLIDERPEDVEENDTDNLLTGNLEQEDTVEQQ